MSGTLPAQTLLVLVGLPGSGKSTLSQSLVSSGWAHINQDVMGDRRVCEDACFGALTSGRNVVVDRCNFDDRQRSHWVRIAREACGQRVRVLALQLLLPVEECRRRVRNRRDHPTLRAHNCDEVIGRFFEAFVVADRREGFAEVFTAYDSVEAEAALARIMGGAIVYTARPVAPAAPPPHMLPRPEALLQRAGHLHGGALRQPHNMPQRAGPDPSALPPAWASSATHHPGHEPPSNGWGWGQDPQHSNDFRPTRREHAEAAAYRQPPHWQQLPYTTPVRGDPAVALPARADVGWPHRPSASEGPTWGGSWPASTPHPAPIHQPPHGPTHIGDAWQHGMGRVQRAADGCYQHEPIGVRSHRDNGSYGHRYDGGANNGAHQHQQHHDRHHQQQSNSVAGFRDHSSAAAGGGGRTLAPEPSGAIDLTVGLAGSGRSGSGGLAPAGGSGYGSAAKSPYGSALNSHLSTQAGSDAAGGPALGLPAEDLSECRRQQQERRHVNKQEWRGAEDAKLRETVADPTSTTPYDMLLGPGSEADPRAILLFDLNGTLTSHTSKRKSAGSNRMRPGTEHLLRLKQHFRLGIYTSSTLRTVTTVRRMLEQAAGGTLFEEPNLILYREHTQPAPPEHVAAGGDAWDTVKPLGRWFSRLHRVVLVDDDAFKAMPGEESNMLLVPCWLLEDPACPVLCTMTDALLEHASGLGADDDVRHLTKMVQERVALVAKAAEPAAAAAPRADGAAGGADDAVVLGKRARSALDNANGCDNVNVVDAAGAEIASERTHGPRECAEAATPVALDPAEIILLDD